MLNIPSPIVPMPDVIKQEVSQSGSLYHHGHDQEFQVSGAPWSHMVPISSSPRSSVASFSSNNLLDFTYNKTDHRKNQLPDTSEVIKTDHVLNYYSFFYKFSHLQSLDFHLIFSTNFNMHRLYINYCFKIIFHEYVSLVLFQCNSTATAGVYKKTKSQPSSSQPPLKVTTLTVPHHFHY